MYIYIYTCTCISLEDIILEVCTDTAHTYFYMQYLYVHRFVCIIAFLVQAHDRAKRRGRRLFLVWHKNCWKRNIWSKAKRCKHKCLHHKFWWVVTYFNLPILVFCSPIFCSQRTPSRWAPSCHRLPGWAICGLRQLRSLLWLRSMTQGRMMQADDQKADLSAWIWIKRPMGSSVTCPFLLNKNS